METEAKEKDGMRKSKQTMHLLRMGADIGNKDQGNGNHDQKDQEKFEKVLIEITHALRVHNCLAFA